MNREFLVTKLVCSKCGRTLKLSPDVPKNSGGNYSSGEPTGAAMMCQIVAVEPCECSEKKLEAVRDAVKALVNI